MTCVARPSNAGGLCALTLGVLLATAAAAGADSLAGRVLDGQGLAIANATVRLVDRTTGEQRNAVSAGDGRYSFPGVPAGSYVIEADAVNAALIVTREVAVRGDQQLDLTLGVAPGQSEILVTATSTPQSLTETAKAIDIVGADQMNRRNVVQITDALRVLPGIQVQTQEGPGSMTTIQIRGLRTFDTAVLIDGMRFQDSGSLQNDATSFLGDLLVTDTERVELLRGSSSSLYGSSAMAGVINIVARAGGGDTQGELRGEGGGLGLFRGVAGIGGGAGDGRLGYSAAISRLNVANGVRGRSPNDNTSIQGSLKYSARPGLTLTARGWGSRAGLMSTESPAFTPAVLANSQAGTRVRAVPLSDAGLEAFERGEGFAAGSATYIPNQIDPDGSRRSSFAAGMATLQQVVSNRTTYRLAYQGVDTRRGYRDGPAGTYAFDPITPSTGHFNGRTDTLQARLDHRFGNHHLITAGYEWMQERYSTFTDTPSDDTRTDAVTLSLRSHSLYAQDQVQLLGSRLQVSVAGRVQLFDLQQPEFAGSARNPYEGSIGALDVPTAYTGDLSAAYLFNRTGSKLRVHAGNSYRAPSAYERFGGGFDTYYGDPRLRPERSVSIDGGVDQWLFDSKLQVSGTLFWTSFQEMIRFASALPADDPFRRFFGYENGGGLAARGAELGVRLSPTQQTQAQISYTYADSESTTPTAPAYSPNYFKSIGLAPHTFALSVTQWVTPRLQATFDLFTRSDYHVTLFGATGRLFEFDGPTKANLVVGYQIPVSARRGLELYMKIENLFDQRPYEDGFIGPDRWAVAGVRFKY